MGANVLHVSISSSQESIEGIHHPTRYNPTLVPQASLLVRVESVTGSEEAPVPGGERLRGFVNLKLFGGCSCTASSPCPIRKSKFTFYLSVPCYSFYFRRRTTSRQAYLTFSFSPSFFHFSFPSFGYINHHATRIRLQIPDIYQYILRSNQPSSCYIQRHLLSTRRNCHPIQYY